MKTRFSIAALILALTPTYGAVEGLDEICTTLHEPDFFEDMRYLLSSSERCTGHCDSGEARVGKTVAVRIVADHLTKTQDQTVESSVSWALSTLSEVVGPEIQVELVDTFDDASVTKIVVFPVTYDLDRALIENGLPGLSADEYVFPHRAVLVEGGCSMRFFISELNSVETITLSYVFASAQSIKDPSDLDLCILEEITHAFGLFGDPPGSASLFDFGNVDASGARPRHSKKTNAMLRYMYSGNPMNEEKFNSYRELICGQIE